MDTLPDKVFMGIFKRTTVYLTLTDAMTAEEIDERMKNVCMDMLRHEHATDDERKAHRWRTCRHLLTTLRHHHFGDRVIAEAVSKPHGRIALTLRYGRRRAEEILRERARQRPRRIY